MSACQNQKCYANVTLQHKHVSLDSTHSRSVKVHWSLFQSCQQDSKVTGAHIVKLVPKNLTYHK